MTSKEHQELIKQNIEAAIKAGNKQRVKFLRKTFAALLEIKL